jgi:hypothetical protein
VNFKERAELSVTHIFELRSQVIWEYVKRCDTAPTRETADMLTLAAAILMSADKGDAQT